MLGAAQANAFGSEQAGLAGVTRHVGIGAHFQAARLIRPTHQRREGPGQLRRAHFCFASQHAPRAAVDRDNFAGTEDALANAHCSSVTVNAQRAGSRYARAAHAARDDCCVARHAAACRQNANGRVHAVNILWARFGPHQYNVLAFGFERFCHLGMKRDLT